MLDVIVVHGLIKLVSVQKLSYEMLLSLRFVVSLRGKLRLLGLGVISGLQ